MKRRSLRSNLPDYAKGLIAAVNRAEGIEPPHLAMMKRAELIQYIQRLEARIIAAKHDLEDDDD